jgi:hypothetical protein
MLHEKPAQLPRGLKRGDVAIHIQAIDARNGQGNVVADNLVHVGHLSILLGEKGFEDATSTVGYAGPSRAGANTCRFEAELR